MYVLCMDLYDISLAVKTAEVEPVAPKWAPDTPKRMACGTKRCQVDPEKLPMVQQMCSVDQKRRQVDPQTETVDQQWCQVNQKRVQWTKKGAGWINKYAQWTKQICKANQKSAQRTKKSCFIDRGWIVGYYWKKNKVLGHIYRNTILNIKSISTKQLSTGILKTHVS